MKKEVTVRISNRAQLKQRISALHAAMEDKEEQLKKDLKEVHASIRASNIIRNAIKDIREQPDLQMGIAQAATDIGAHALIEKIMFRKNRGLKHFLLSVLFKKIADHFILKQRIKNAT